MGCDRVVVDIEGTNASETGLDKTKVESSATGEKTGESWTTLAHVVHFDLLDSLIVTSLQVQANLDSMPARVVMQ